MTCRDVLELLSDHRTGGLPPETREAVARHLESCASCRAYADSYESTIAIARAAEREGDAPAPAALVDAILAARPRA